MSTVSEVLARKSELEAALKTRVDANIAVADASKVEDGVIVVDEKQRTEFKKNMGEIKSIQGELADLDTIINAEKYLSVVEEPSIAGAVNASPEAEAAIKTLGELFLASEAFKAASANPGVGNHVFDLKIDNVTRLMNGEFGVKDIYAGNPGTPSDFTARAVQRLDLVDRQRRSRRVRELFPQQTTSAAVIEFWRVTGYTNNASTVGQRNDGNSAFGLKPKSELTFGAEQTPIRTIAHWMAAHRNVLADEPRLRSIIDTELLYGLALVEDAQILAGSGSGEDLLGILNTPGIQQYSWSNGVTQPVPDTKADAIRRAATLAYLAEYQPNGVVMHPNDWEDLELTKNSMGDYLLAVSIAVGGEPRVWGMPVIDTPAIQEGTALVANFGVGFQLFDREMANIRVAEEHDDYFARNAIAILAEERLALIGQRPESAVEVTFDAAPS